MVSTVPEVIEAASSLIRTSCLLFNHDCNAAALHCVFPELVDFPLGDVVLEEALVMDKGDDGVGLSVSHVTVGQDVLGGYEKVCVGSIKFGTRSSQVCIQTLESLRLMTIAV